MRICKTTHKTLSFGTNERVVRQCGNLVLRNCTRLFREDLNWNIISEIIPSQRIRPKIYCYACSDGSEAYSIKLALIRKLGIQKSQNFKIEARDIDKEMIKKAQSGIISLSPKDFYVGTNFMKESMDNFFTPQSDEYSYTIIDKLKFYSRDISGKKFKEIFSSVRKDKLREFFKSYRIAKATKDYKSAESIRDGVIFRNGDLIQDAENIDFANTVIFFRNVWPYLKDKDIKKLLHTFKSKFTDKTFLILGYFDKKPKIINTNLNLPQKFEEIGLKEIYPKVYTKQ